MGRMGVHRLQMGAIWLAAGVAALISLAACSSDGGNVEPGAYLAILERVERERASDPPLSYVRVVEMFSREEILRTEPGDWGPPIRWAPGGRHLTASLTPRNGPLRMVVIDLPSGDTHESEAIELEVLTEPAWSPEGELFAMGMDRLAVFDARARKRFETAVAPRNQPGSTWSPPQWSPGGEWVIGSANSTFYLASREKPLASQDLSQLSAGGVALPAGTWVAGGSRWTDDTSFEVLLIDRYTPPRDHFYEARGRVEGEEVAWEALTALAAPPVDWAPTAVPPEVDLEALVPDGDFSWDSTPAMPPLQTAEGTAWVYQVPGGPRDRPWQSWPFAVKLVIIDGERAGVVELADPLTGLSGGQGPIDVILVRD